MDMGFTGKLGPQQWQLSRLLHYQPVSMRKGIFRMLLLGLCIALMTFPSRGCRGFVRFRIPAFYLNPKGGKIMAQKPKYRPKGHCSTYFEGSGRA